MEFRRAGRDERRRRVLLEETAGGGGAATPPARRAAASGDTESASRYSPAALRENQPRLTDLVPRRPWTMTVVALLVLCPVVLHLSLVSQSLVADSGGSYAIGVRAMVSRGGAWLASMLLGVSAAAACLTYMLRRHRTDDYRGRYRVWLWAALALAAGSVECTLQSHALAGRLLADLVPQALPGQDAWLGLAVYALAWGAVAIRLVFELWTSRWALVAMVLALAAYVAGSAIDRLAWTDLAVSGMAAAALLPLAHYGLWLATVLNVRHVFLDAQGAFHDRDARRAERREARRRRRAERREAGPDTVEAAAERPGARRAAAPLRRGDLVDTARSQEASTPSGHTSGQPPTSGQPRKRVRIDAAETGQSARISKAERRRLRKLRRQDSADD